MEEELYLLINRDDEITTQLLKQGILCKPRSLSSAAPKGLKVYHQHNFSLLRMIDYPHPMPSIYTWEKREVSKVRMVETVEIVMD